MSIGIRIDMLTGKEEGRRQGRTEEEGRTEGRSGFLSQNLPTPHTDVWGITLITAKHLRTLSVISAIQMLAIWLAKMLARF